MTPPRTGTNDMKATAALIASATVLRAAEIAIEEGNVLREISEGWSKANQVVHMARELSALARQRIESEVPSLRYWRSPGTPHNPATCGFISDDDGTGLAFPDNPPPFTATPWMPPMIDRNEALASARHALNMLAVRLARNPGYGVHIHASEQLTRMIEELGQRRLSPAADRAWVDIGLMAAKELESSDAEFADALMQADFDFKHAE